MQAIIASVLSIRDRRNEAFIFDFRSEGTLFFCYFFGPFSEFPAFLIKESWGNPILDRLAIFDIAMLLRRYLGMGILTPDLIKNKIIKKERLRIINNICQINFRLLPLFAVYDNIRWRIYQILEDEAPLISIDRLRRLLDSYGFDLSIRDIEESLRIMEIAGLVKLESIYGVMSIELIKKIIIEHRFSFSNADQWKLLEIFLDPEMLRMYSDISRREITKREINHLMSRFLKYGILSEKGEGTFEIIPVKVKITDQKGMLLWEITMEKALRFWGFPQQD